MKMTLTSPNTSSASNDKLISPSPENRPPSPNSSPRSSPRPSPRPQTKRDHSSRPASSHLSVSSHSGSGSKEGAASRQDGSPSSQEGSSGGRLNSSSAVEISPVSADLNKPESSGSSTRDRKEGRGKKKSSWLNTFYPTYKSRSEDFKRIFKEVPDDERLVVDYSCALQKEILVQGRLYVTQNYLCFYANIFGWETCVTLKWKDVSAITKEKTAIVIPNAVLIWTRTDKYFFTSFVARDKTYLMLFRVWQNALMDQPMTPPEMWQWVHQSYGDELGLTSDDEDYIAPGTEEDKLSARLSVESFSEQECGGGSAGDRGVIETMTTVPTTTDTNDKMEEEGVVELREKNMLMQAATRESIESRLLTDLSDTTESDVEKQMKCDISKVRCTCTHEGRQLLNEIVPIHVDQLFTLLFTSSKFYLDFHAGRKTTNLTQTPWTHNPTDSSKSRVVNLTVSLNQTMGPKTSMATESQIMLPCSKAGILYSINTETVNAGIPYADSFFIDIHYCLKKITEQESSITVFAQVKYKKSVWGLVKGMIEKTCWLGLEDFYTSLYKSLLIESEENVPDIRRKSRRKRRIHSMPRSLAEDSHHALLLGTATRKSISSGGVFSSDVATLIVFTVLILLVILNLMLYYKLWSLEEAPPYTLLDLHILNDPPKSHDDWIKLLQQQETLHSVEIQKWQRVLKTAIQLLKQTEESLNQLQLSISPTNTNKVMSVLQNHKDSVEKEVKTDL